MDMRDEKDDERRSKIWRGFQEAHKEEIRKVESVMQRNIANFKTLADCHNQAPQEIGPIMQAYARFPGFYYYRDQSGILHMKVKYHEAMQLQPHGVPEPAGTAL